MSRCFPFVILLLPMADSNGTFLLFCAVGRRSGFSFRLGSFPLPGSGQVRGPGQPRSASRTRCYFPPRESPSREESMTATGTYSRWARSCHRGAVVSVFEQLAVTGASSSRLQRAPESFSGQQSLTGCSPPAARSPGSRLERSPPARRPVRLAGPIRRAAVFTAASGVGACRSQRSWTSSHRAEMPRSGLHRGLDPDGGVPLAHDPLGPAWINLHVPD